MKNQTKRVEDTLNQNKSARKTRKPNRDDNKKSAQDLEKAAVRKMMKPDNTVWDILAKITPKHAAIADEFYGDPLNSPWRRESDRIKDFSLRFKDKTVAESFAEVYDLKGLARELGNETPKQLTVGAVVELTIKSVSKLYGVLFDSGIYKDTFITRNNLSSFTKFKYGDPGKVRAKVIEMTPNGVVVDVIGQLADEFILPRASEPWTQNLLVGYKPVIVKDLHLVRGGYLGKAVIPTVSEFVGQDMTVDAFIPGSQIVQNTTNDFEQFEGATVEAFISAWSPKPNGKGMSLICSCKNLIKHVGNLKLKEVHNMWCDQGDAWDDFAKIQWRGLVTGVINSSKKCGVFVEVPDLSITGMIHCKPDELVNFKAGDEIKVNLVDFDEEMRYQEGADQYQHVPAFEIERGAIKKMNIKPILKMA